MARNWTMPGEYERPRYFGGGGPSNPPPPPPPPQPTDPAIAAASATARRLALARRGRSSTILAGNQPSPELATTTPSPGTGGKLLIGD